MLDFATVLRSQTFKFLVGEHGDCFNIPSTLAKGISPPLYEMMNGEMKEAKDGVAVLNEVESETFTAFCEYAYTGSYQVPKVTADFEKLANGSSSNHSSILHAQSSVTGYEVMDAQAESIPVVKNITEVELASALEHDQWIPSTKKFKKNKKKKDLGLEASDEDRPPIKIPREKDSSTGKERHSHLWNEFCNLKYNTVPEEFEEGLINLDRTTEIEFKPLLFHCKLYVFAQMYLMASLKQLTLRKLHAALKSFYLNLTSSNEVLEVVKFAFTNTERGEDHDDELRKLLVAYAASNTTILKQNASFRTLLDAHGELGSDIVQLLG